MHVTRRRSCWIVAAALAVGMLVPATVAVAGIRWGRYAIGDSVMLGARDELRARGFRMTAEVSRQFDDVVAIVRKLAAAGRLPRNVIVHLGNNGRVEGDDCDALVRAAGPKRRVYLVTLKIPRPSRDPNNRRLRACAHRHENASVIDWYDRSRYHRAWFYDDGYHLRPSGQREYARFIDANV
jgi:hypothetical protein